jgi:hypothetical protein
MAFDMCNLTLITNLNPEPIALPWNVFSRMDQSACTLEVPMGSVSAYQNATVWKEFNIVGIEVGIEEVLPTDIMKIHPNPTTGKIHLETESAIKLYNLQGELLHETFGNQIDLSKYPQGVYLFQVNGKWSKMVKQ